MQDSYNYELRIYYNDRGKISYTVIHVSTNTRTVFSSSIVAVIDDLNDMAMCEYFHGYAPLLHLPLIQSIPFNCVSELYNNYPEVFL